MIYRQEGYVLKKIRGVYALLPFGQAVADLKKGITLNETGVLLWKELYEPKTREELAQGLSIHYEANEEEQEEIKKDVEEFINFLLIMGILREELKPLGEPVHGCMRIGKLYVRLRGKKQFFSEQFTPFFAEENAAPDMELEVVYGAPAGRQTGEILLYNKEVVVSTIREGYAVRFPSMPNIVEAYMTEEGEYVRLYCLNTDDSRTDRENIFHAVRHFFLYMAQKRGYTAVHSASVFYKNKAWLFSGHSGAGKSTHTALWKERFGVPCLNGDLNLVGKDCDGSWKVYGIPWCGTSGISTRETYDLGGIVLLKQADRDYVEELSPYEKAVRVMQRMISPSWTEELMNKNLDSAQEIAEEVPVYQLFCTKNVSAADTMKAKIDL